MQADVGSRDAYAPGRITPVKDCTAGVGTRHLELEPDVRTCTLEHVQTAVQPVHLLENHENVPQTLADRLFTGEQN